VAAQLRQALDVESELVTGNPGEFTVWIDGAKVAEKANGRFPEPDEVIAAVRARLTDAE
jgi:predicted Rdx family selenoprotein